MEFNKEGVAVTTGKRTHVVVPEDLLKEIDKLLGKRKRSWFIAEAAKKEIRRLKFLKALKETAGAWKDEDHPELKRGVDSWVRSLRDQDEKRLKEIL